MTDLIQKFKRLENLIITTQKQVLSINELCAFAGLSKSTVYKLIMSGGMPHYKQSKCLYFDEDEVINWFKEAMGYNADELKQNAHKTLCTGSKLPNQIKMVK